MDTGAKYPGMAQDAATAAPTEAAGAPGWPNTVNRPVSRCTAQSHNGDAGHPEAKKWSIPSAIVPVGTVPSGNRAAATAAGRIAHGRRAAANKAPGADGRGQPSRRRPGAVEAFIQLAGTPAAASNRLPSADKADGGLPSARAARSVALKPARSRAAVIDPADVPTMISDRRGSQPTWSARAPSTPA
jgi:hypothetical protein